MIARETATFIPDNLVAGCPDDIITGSITLSSGQNLVRGAVLGKTAVSGTIVGAAVAGNTGNGTIGSLSVRGSAKQGIYHITCIEDITNGGHFSVQDPDGENIGTATVAKVYTGGIRFTIADGSTDFAVGDAFTATVSALAVEYQLSVANATTGIQYPDAILVEDTDATDADTQTVAYIAGSFNENALTLGAGHTADSVKEGLRSKSIYLVATG